mmetsp:Transcript_24735/g.61409  ORF Transcript_24735/g.61409 Transcript_24735/m.61409 type:complete len:205 (-) Transcript_24735:48-662(-)
MSATEERVGHPDGCTCAWMIPNHSSATREFSARSSQRTVCCEEKRKPPPGIVFVISNAPGCPANGRATAAASPRRALARRQMESCGTLSSGLVKRCSQPPRVRTPSMSTQPPNKSRPESNPLAWRERSPSFSTCAMLRCDGESTALPSPAPLTSEAPLARRNERARRLPAEGEAMTGAWVGGQNSMAPSASGRRLRTRAWIRTR